MFSSSAERMKRRAPAGVSAAIFPRDSSVTMSSAFVAGCRKGEIVNLRSDHVDFERECLRLADSKTGAKVVYLNAPARALLCEPRV